VNTRKYILEIEYIIYPSEDKVDYSNAK
jgi:hypothetical protein